VAAVQGRLAHWRVLRQALAATQREALQPMRRLRQPRLRAQGLPPVQVRVPVVGETLVLQGASAWAWGAVWVPS